MKKKIPIGKKILAVTLLVTMLIIAACSKIGNGEEIMIYKSVTCGCCSVFSKYMDKQGFNVKVVNTDSRTIKDDLGIPSQLQTCHTTKIGNYFIEGHVPIEAIEKLMTEKPDIKGIALPGMPSGSPGMPGAKTGPWVIYAVHNDGGTSEFMRI